MTPTQSLITACATLVLLTFIVGGRLLQVRVAEMKRKRIHPQAVALSAQRREKLEDTRASDNYNHLFEVPVLFYALCATALAVGEIPAWLVIGAWAFVALRIVHSLIQCSYNKVMHRLMVFLVGFGLIVALWMGYAVALIRV
jgi:hypothetical protein